jgi:hypothetical protein
MLMNTTALNQATHCIVSIGIFRPAQELANTILYSLKYCQVARDWLGKYFGIFPSRAKISGPGVFS